MSVRASMPWLWQSASRLASRMHAGHFRRDGETPYFSHVVRVTLTLRQVFNHHDEITLAAALLHDLIEDTPGDREDITKGLTKAGKRAGVPEDEAAAIADEVADLVVAMTKDMRLREAEREAQYDAGLQAADWRARLIKLADTYDNLTDALETSKKPTRSIEKAQRAIALAEPDRDRLEVARGIEVLERVIGGI